MTSVNLMSEKSLSLDKTQLPLLPLRTSPPIAIPTAIPTRHVPLTPPPSIRSRLSKSSSKKSESPVKYKRSISISSIKNSMSSKSRNNSTFSISSIDDDYSFKRRSITHPLSNPDDEVPVYDYFSSYYLEDDYDQVETDEDEYSINSCSTCESSLTKSTNSRFENYTLRQTSQSFASPLLVPRKSTSIVSSVNTITTGYTTSTSSELLIKLLNEVPQSPEPKRFVSNLTSSLNSIKKSVKQNLLAYSLYLSPSVADEVFPTPLQVEKEMDVINKNFIHSYDSMDDFIKLVPSKTFKNRDDRINSNFLRLYAQDYNSRLNKLLPDNYSNEEFLELYNKSRGIKEFHHRYNFYKISNLNRDKLWNSVILPARFDNCPNSSIDHSSYVFMGNNAENNNSLITLNGNFLPWARENNRTTESIKPSGILQGVKGCENGPSPSSGMSKTQFTIKGWCNKRWLDSSDLDE